jgi:hypothetical protein
MRECPHDKPVDGHYPLLLTTDMPDLHITEDLTDKNFITISGAKEIKKNLEDQNIHRAVFIYFKISIYFFKSEATLDRKHKYNHSKCKKPSKIRTSA